MMSSPNFSKLKVTAQREGDVFRMLPSSGHLMILLMIQVVKKKKKGAVMQKYINMTHVTHYFSVQWLNNTTENKKLFVTRVIMAWSDRAGRGLLVNFKRNGSIKRIQKHIFTINSHLDSQSRFLIQHSVAWAQWRQDMGMIALNEMP